MSEEAGKTRERARIRLLLVISQLSGGGAEHVFARLARILCRETFELHIGLWRPVVEYPVPDDVTIHNLKKYHSWHLPRVISNTTRLIESIQPDVVFSSLYYPNLATGEAVLRATHKTAWICRFGNPPSRQVRGFLRMWARQVLPAAAFVTANSQGLCEEIKKYFLLGKDRVRLLPNIYDLDRIESRSSEGVPVPRSAGTFVVAHAARLCEQKNQHLLFRAFASFSEQNSELWILGRGPLERRLRRFAKKLGIADRVRWLGFLENPYPFLSAADCFVLSSDWEGMPNALVETMTCGTPVIATDCSYGPAEIVEQGRSGFLVPPGDVDALADAMKRMAAEPAMRKEMGKNARQAIREKYDSSRVLVLYENLFKKAVDQSSDG